MNPKTRKDGFSVVGLGVAACVACCAGPVLTVLGGLGIAGIASTWLIGGFGLLIAAVVGLACIAVHRRRTATACATAPADVVPIAFTDRRANR